MLELLKKKNVRNRFLSENNSRPQSLAGMLPTVASLHWFHSNLCKIIFSPLLGSKTICFSNLDSPFCVTEGLDSVLVSFAMGHANLSFEKRSKIRPLGSED